MVELSLNEVPLDGGLGQVWTPREVAEVMVDSVSKFLGPDSRILDPAFGPGTFFVASIKKELKFQRFDCYEIDPRLFEATRHLMADPRLEILNMDFLDSKSLEGGYDVAILNPPYIRHEQISSACKAKLDLMLKNLGAARFTRRMNYFGYFLIKTASLLRDGGVMCAIIYDSLASTQYGRQIENFLKSNGEILSREVIPTPFKRAIIDAEILIWKKMVRSGAQVPTHVPRDETKPRDGYCRISDLAACRRGTSFVKRDFFVCSQPDESVGHRPLLTKQPLSRGLLVVANTYGALETDDPFRDEQTLLQLRKRHAPSRLDTVRALPRPVVGEIVFNYYLRKSPRHLLNPAKIPCSDNFYCINPIDADSTVLHWVVANSRQAVSQLIASSRSQGSGLRKLQLFEYQQCLIPDYRLFGERLRAEILEIGALAIVESWSAEQLCSEASLALTNAGFVDENS